MISLSENPKNLGFCTFLTENYVPIFNNLEEVYKK